MTIIKYVMDCLWAKLGFFCEMKQSLGDFIYRDKKSTGLQTHKDVFLLISARQSQSTDECLLSVPRKKRKYTSAQNGYTCNFCSIEGCMFMYLIVLVNVYHYPLCIHACTLALLYIHVCDCACQKIFCRYASNLMDICLE